MLTKSDGLAEEENTWRMEISYRLTFRIAVREVG